MSTALEDCNKPAAQHCTHTCTHALSLHLYTHTHTCTHTHTHTVCIKHYGSAVLMWMNVLKFSSRKAIYLMHHHASPCSTAQWEQKAPFSTVNTHSNGYRSSLYSECPVKALQVAPSGHLNSRWSGTNSQYWSHKRGHECQLYRLHSGYKLLTACLGNHYKP